MAPDASSLQPEALGALLGRCALHDQRAFAELYRITSAKPGI
ncbi:MAG TPA: hypothetical protein VGQ88_04790 [Burkholderiales bacterium]|nr:hypothetical protein [Burkholderiales bacterium]